MHTQVHTCIHIYVCTYKMCTCSCLSIYIHIHAYIHVLTQRNTENTAGLIVRGALVHFLALLGEHGSWSHRLEAEQGCRCGLVLVTSWLSEGQDLMMPPQGGPQEREEDQNKHMVWKGVPENRIACSRRSASQGMLASG